MEELDYLDYRNWDFLRQTYFFAQKFDQKYLVRHPHSTEVTAGKDQLVVCII